MDTYCFTDYETTGFPRGQGRHDGQARACQVAMLLTDDTGRSLAEFCSLIKPDGWKVGAEAEKVHGFSTEHCERYGVSYKTAVGFYKFMASKATFFVAHNADFDAQIMDIEVDYYNACVGTQALVQIVTPWICTMKPNTDIVKAPNKNGKPGFKWPTLEETMQFYLGRGLGEYAHDAMYDVKGCRDVFFEAKKRKAA